MGEPDQPPRCQATLWAIPSGRAIRGRQPTSSRSRVTSATSEGGRPAGVGIAPISRRSAPPAGAAISPARSRRRTPAPEATLTGPSVSRRQRGEGVAGVGDVEEVADLGARGHRRRLRRPGASARRRARTAGGLARPVEEEQAPPGERETPLGGEGLGDEVESVLGRPVERAAGRRGRPRRRRAGSSRTRRTSRRSPPAARLGPRRTRAARRSVASTQSRFSGAVQNFPCSAYQARWTRISGSDAARTRAAAGGSASRSASCQGDAGGRARGRAGGRPRGPRVRRAGAPRAPRGRRSRWRR